MKKLAFQTCLAYGLVLLLPIQTRAQIGKMPAAFRAAWGAPTTIAATNGSGVLQFSAQGITLEVHFVHGTAQRIRCSHLGGWNEETIRSMLALNAEQASWDELPSSTGSESGKRTWMRSDEMAMAQLNGDTLEIIGPEWNRLIAQPSASAATTPKDIAAPVPIPPASQMGDPVCGHWLHKRDGVCWTLQVRPDGTAIMTRLDDTACCAITTQWAQATGTGTGQVTYLFRSVATPEQSPVSMGTAVLAGADTFRLQLKQAEGRLDVLWPPEAFTRPLDFSRVDTLPTWKPKAPYRMPKQGDHRDVALQLLGPPTGTMRMGSREVLIYPWGRIWIVSGTVAAID